MKFILSILVLCGITFGVLGQEFNAMGISKKSNVFVTEFTESLNTILGSIGYIQFYDVSEIATVWPEKPEVVLGNIEVSGLKVASPLNPTTTTYTATNEAVILSSDQLAMSADINLRWTYKINGETIFVGSYGAKLSTTSSSVTFTFKHDSPVAVGDIKFGWQVSDPVVSGFGATKLISQFVGEIIEAKLYPVFHEELNRYNDVIVSGVVFNSFYRSLPIPMPADFQDKLSIKNTFKKFLIVHSNNLDYISFVFSSGIFYAIQHVEIPLNETFIPADDYSQGISLYFGANQMGQLFDHVKQRVEPKNFVISSEDQKKLFGYELTIDTLAVFYPKLAEDYDPNERLLFKCDIKDASEPSKKYMFACKFVLASDETVAVFDIEELAWSSVFGLSIVNGKELELGITKYMFSDLKLRYPSLPVHVAKQFLAFLQPMANYPGEKISFKFTVVPPSLSWEYVSSEVSAAGDLTVHLKPQP